MRELQAGVRQNVEKKAIALSEDDADTVVGKGIDAGDLAEVTLEVGGGAHLAVDLVAVEGEVEPELDILGGEGRAVVPENVVAEGECPDGVAGVDGPRGGEVGAGDVEVASAAHERGCRGRRGRRRRGGERCCWCAWCQSRRAGHRGWQGRGHRRRGRRRAGAAAWGWLASGRMSARRGLGWRGGDASGAGAVWGDGGILGGARRREAREGEGEEDGGW